MDILRPAARRYSGAITRPDRWATWAPRDGDILVCTPPKSGTTWTQTMLAMLVNGGPELPAPLGAISPWVDADLGVGPAEVARTIEALPGRRVLKTHTPADGFPVWDGVTVVAVYRHPLDVFFSLRKHIANRHVGEDHPMKGPVSEALARFLDGPMDPEDLDNDALAIVVHHYLQTARSGRVPGLVLMHYADMIRDAEGTLRQLAGAAGIAVSDAAIAAIAEASGIDAMRGKAELYAPVGGTGFWKEDAAFFATGGAGNWQGQLTEADLAAYEARITALIPDPEARGWLERGAGG
ncbi:sulfotransferase domain-containing protein [Pseudooceanicola sp. C21-150M6]|uniref:sulfotransferase domain-containing protein n=1 Tax=Pseudooceanicola sp. C21-150M6 TaxID=3434355 RepID=UPI003D7F8FA5